MFAALLVSVALSADPVAQPKSAKEAFAPLGPLIGGWKGTGRADDKEKTFWSERVEWVWKFKGDDAWLTATFETGKHYTAGELRYDLKKGECTLTLTGADKAERVFVGKLTTGKKDEAILTVERTAGETVEQFTLTVLHHNRHLYQLATRPKAATSFTRQFQVGATKEGEPFAEVAKGPECIVSGGRGTTAVSYKGVTYYVCCSGCRDEFKADPEKYIKLAAEKKK
jgi:YHS domain-containing protein